MSNIKFSKNLFLDVQELNRFKKFMTEDGFIRMFKSIVKTYGIVGGDDFSVTHITGDQIQIKAGLAYDQDLNAILLESDLVYDLTPAVSTTKWLRIYHNKTNLEQGTVSVTGTATSTSRYGRMLGDNTRFTEILRGQPNFPVKVSFPLSNLNTGVYEVVSVTDDGDAVVSGILTNESNLRYAVVGCFTPGFIPNSSDSKIYEYDSMSVEVIESETQPVDETGKFLIARIQFNELGVPIVADYRSEFFSGLNERSDNQTEDNFLASLFLANKHTSGFGVELGFDFGYDVSGSSSSWSGSDITMNISGTCNVLGSGDIPDNSLNGWLVFNRASQTYLRVLSNVNKTLKLSGNAFAFFQGFGDYVIVPDFQDIEFEIIVKEGVSTKSPIYHKTQLQNCATRFWIPLMSTDAAEISLKYKLSSGLYNQTIFMPLAAASFSKNGVSTVLTDSKFNI